MQAYDAACIDCGEMHVIWVSESHEEGDVVKYAHPSCSGPGYGKHLLAHELSGLGKREPRIARG